MRNATNKLYTLRSGVSQFFATFFLFKNFFVRSSSLLKRLLLLLQSPVLCVMRFSFFSVAHFLLVFVQFTSSFKYTRNIFQLVGCVNFFAVQLSAVVVHSVSFDLDFVVLCNVYMSSNAIILHVISDSDARCVCVWCSFFFVKKLFSSSVNQYHNQLA